MVPSRAREMMMKCGWTEGKGLGKDECGITEPVKLATTQNKAGIGYSENNPWWEKMFDDAIKNVKVTSHGDEVSLSVVSDTDASRLGGECMISGRKFTPRRYTKNWNDWKTFVKSEVTFDDQKLTLTNPYSCDTFTRPILMRKPPLDQTTSICFGEMMDETTGHNLTSSGGKLERIAEQDRILLNKSLSDTTLTRENDTSYRKTNVESDVEEKEHEIDSIESILQFDGNWMSGKSRTRKKKDKKRIHMLATRLGACNLEKERHDFPKIRTLCQKMKKNKEKKVDKSTLLTCLATDTSGQVTMSQSPEVHGNKSRVSNSFKERRSRMNTLINILQSGKSVNEKDSVGHKIELSPELTNSIEGNKVTDKRCKDCIIDLDAEKQDYDRYSMRNLRWDALKLDIPENHPVLKLGVVGELPGLRKELLYAAKECGITEPVKLATAQNKEGIGYSETNPWREKMFDDAIKNVRVTSRGDEVSLSLVSDTCSPRIYRTEEFENWKHPDREDRLKCQLISNHKLKKESKRRCKKRLGEIIASVVRRGCFNHQVNSVINDLTSFSLTEEVKADTIKKKPTQTHRTSV
ncbi:uncharacterized protein [Temnothorax longispinosus]|uniref:G patch domain-containing protein 4 n=2 Tax=Temnothorax longispinosus TaxID=300112 RepID=A0A4S2KYM0_9HYME|nr:hypothetical protein DBV15_04278 [Temnothorax longispinosus]